jgi:serine protease
MKRWTVTLCLLAAIATAQPALSGEFQKAHEKGIAGSYIVVLKPSALGLTNKSSFVFDAADTEQLADSITARFAARPAAVYGHIGQFLFKGSEEAAKRLAQDPRVLLVEQDAVIEVSAIPSCYDNVSNFPLANSYTPTSPQTISCWDPQLNCTDNWGLDRIDQTTGSQSAHTLDSKFYFSATGSGTHIYILDTGIIASHTEFALSPSGNRVGAGINLVPVETSTNTDDDIGHGTHVAAIAAGRRFGVAKAATIHPVRIFQNGGATISTAVSGVNWIASNHVDPAVVNMSFNYNKALVTTTSLDSAVSTLISTYGVTVVNSAGNWNQDATDFSPTGVSTAIVVAGLDWVNNQHWGASPTNGCRNNGCGSNWGSGVDLYAPAVDVLAALGSGENNLACTLTGTSMAAPHVAGVVAQYLQNNPTATPATVHSFITSTATSGVVTGTLGGSPNLLLFTNL